MRTTTEATAPTPPRLRRPVNTTKTGRSSTGARPSIPTWLSISYPGASFRCRVSATPPEDDHAQDPDPRKNGDRQPAAREQTPVGKDQGQVDHRQREHHVPGPAPGPRARGGERVGLAAGDHHVGGVGVARQKDAQQQTGEVPKRVGHAHAREQLGSALPDIARAVSHPSRLLHTDPYPSGITTTSFYAATVSCSLPSALRTEIEKPPRSTNATPTDEQSWKKHSELDGADLTKTNLRDADLTGIGAGHLSQEQIERAIGDDETMLPSHLQPPASWSKSTRSEQKEPVL